MRKTQVKRNTRETRITAEIDLDGTGLYEIETGIGFFDHMLEQLSKHSLIDIKLKAIGDLHIDFHHTIEDCGIVLGMAIRDALGDKNGIKRYGLSYIPMDETLTRCVVDISDRPYPLWNVEIKKDKIGEIDTELFREFFFALAMNLRCNLHIENLYGINSHHIVESCFKSTAKALREAISIDSKISGAASTKGSL